MYIRNLLSSLVLTTLILLGSSVKAHEDYPWECCSNGDCKKVICSQIQETDDGWEWNGLKFKKEQERNFGKPGCHVCVAPATEWRETPIPRCIQPARGV